MSSSYKEITMASSNQGGNQGGNNQGGNKGSKQSGDTSNRGFASMDPQRQREIASEGGRAAHASGNAHEFTSEEARKAGSMSHKNDGNRQSGSQGSGGGGGNAASSGGNTGGSGGTRGGTPEQHAQAGRQSHKNDDKR
ncbi:hypothetical protein GCM10011572_01240 [Pseudoduganella buxea]|uniref:Stress-induced protein n=2 Tax=Pseudoduganella buxea TaxID=1949069 RepID=A0ABQ1JZH6_9BURK|nr:hypothetical protein GCM10011572_01240 [Pseudoduganella buxea]